MDLIAMRHREMQYLIPICVQDGDRGDKEECDEGVLEVRRRITTTKATKVYA